MITLVLVFRHSIEKHSNLYELFDDRHICETPVTEQAFIEQLHELHHKIDFAKEQSFKGALSVNDVGDVLEKLKGEVLYQTWD